MSEERGIGDNGGPKLEKFTAKHKIERIREVLGMDITAAQKCVGIGIVVEADTDGIAAELTTKRLQTMASVSDRETVYRATKVLKEESVAEPIKIKGRPNSYRILPPKVIDSIVEAYNQSKAGPAKPDEGSPVKPDGMPSPHPVGSHPTTGSEHVGSNPTGGSQPVSSNPTCRVSPDHPSRAYKESPSEIDNTKQKQTTTTVEQDPARSGGGDYLDALNGVAADLVAFIGKHNNVEASYARSMLAANVRTFTGEAMLEAYAVTVAKMGSDLVAKPYVYLIETARKIKEGKAAKKAKGETGETARDKINRFAEAVEERARLKKGMRP